MMHAGQTLERTLIKQKPWVRLKYKVNLRPHGCIVWNAHNTVLGSKRSAICATAVYFLHLTMPSVACLLMSDVSIICHVTYFQFPIQFAFLPCWSARPHSGVLG